MRIQLRLAAAICGMAVLGSCGGGSGGGVPPPIVVNPGPMPTPAPTPTPTPTPVPTIRAYAGSAATGRLDFYTGNATAIGDAIAQGFLSRDGFYTPGYRNGLSSYIGLGAGYTLSADYSDRYKRAALFEHETSLYLLMDAPAEARVVTPATALLTSAGLTQAKLKRQLGITGGIFGLIADPDLLTYDAVTEAATGDQARARDASRMFAANLRVLAIVRGLAAVGRPLGGINERSVTQAQDFTRVGGCLNAAGDLFVFTNERMTSLADCVQRTSNFAPLVRTQTLSAIAHLIDAYAAAIPVNLDTPEGQARWRLGIEGWLVPEIVQLSAAQSDAQDAAASAILTPTIIAETQIYAEYYRYNATGRFLTSPDFYVVDGGQSLTLPADDFDSPTWNDFLIIDTDGGIGPNQGVIQSVSVPAAYASRVTATVQSGTISITATAGAPTAAYLDYVIMHPTAGSRTARLYVRIT